MTLPNLDVGAVGPMIVVGVGAILLPLVEVLLSRMRTFLYRPVTEEWIGTVLMFGCAVLLVAALLMSANGFLGEPRVFNPDHPMVLMDGLTHFLNGVLLVGALITVLISSRFLADLGINHGEYYALLMSSLMGMMFLIAAPSDELRSPLLFSPARV